MKQKEEREFFYLLVHSTNAHQGLAKLKLRARNSIWVCHVDARTQVFVSLFAISQEFWQEIGFGAEWLDLDQTL